MGSSQFPNVLRRAFFKGTEVDNHKQWASLVNVKNVKKILLHLNWSSEISMQEYMWMSWTSSHNSSSATFECHALLFQKNVTAREEECTYWLTFVPFTILWPQMGWKSPLHRVFIGVWPKPQQYVDTVHIKRLPNPARAFFETTRAARQDLPVFANLKYFMAVGDPSAPSWQNNNRRMNVSISLQVVEENLIDLASWKFQKCSKAYIN